MNSVALRADLLLHPAAGLPGLLLRLAR